MLNLTHKLLCMVLLATSPLAMAQTPGGFPCKTVKFIVPYPPGGSSDLLARALLPGLTQKLGTTIVVENRTGAGGNIGTAEVARAAGDGCYWLLGNSSNIVISRNLYKLPQDPMEALAPVAEVAAVPMVLYVNSQVPAKNVKQLTEYVKANPAKGAYATLGAGTTHHLLAELMRLDFGMPLTHVPYRGSGPAIQDVLAGHVGLAFEGTSAILPHLDGGKLRALATTGERRSTALPNVPTMKELGYPKFVVTNWYGVFVPKDTPTPLVQQLNRAILETLKSPDIIQTLTKLDSQTSPYTTDQYAKFVAKEGPYWESLVKQTGARVD